METKLLIDGEEQVVSVRERGASHVVFEMAGQEYLFVLRSNKSGEFVLEEERTFTDAGRRKLLHGYIAAQDRQQCSRIWIDGTEITIAPVSRLRRAEGELGGGSTNAPLTGIIREVCVPVGVSVAKGDALIVMEAMKMQMTISAPYPGQVTAIHVAEGDQVTEGTELVTVEQDDAE